MVDGVFNSGLRSEELNCPSSRNFFEQMDLQHWQRFCVHFDTLIVTLAAVPCSEDDLDRQAPLLMP